jgi:hypothetical protein
MPPQSALDQVNTDNDEQVSIASPPRRSAPRKQSSRNGNAEGPAKSNERAPESWKQWISASQRPNDWDGQGAPEIGIATVSAALAFAAKVLKQAPLIPEPMFIGPTRSGQIAIQWDDPEWAMVVEIGGDALEYYRQCILRRGDYRQGPASVQAIINELLECSGPPVDEKA